MKKLSLSLQVCCFIFLVSCSDNTAGTSDVLKDSTPINVNRLSVPTPSTLPGPAQVSTAPATVATPVGNANNLNPAHGQPGHRCDIAVGSPLNSKPGNVTSTPTSNQVTTVSPATIQQTVATTQNPVITKPGMNPPHGQPGHRCDIPVGNPLNSKPVSNQTTTVSPFTTQPNIVTTQTSVQTAPGMNPAHGQPGHRCDIAVGSPLNSKPVTTPVNVVSSDSTKN
jgi:hypothetical protein